MKLNNTQQKWLAIGLLFGIIIILGIIIFMPWYNALNKNLDEIDNQVFRIKRYEKIIASRDKILKKIEQGRKDLNELGYYYTQNTPSLVAAELQKRLKGMVQRAGGDLSSTQVLPNKEQGELLRIAVKIRLTGNMEMLRSLLYDIEFEKPLMSIEDISIVPKPGKRNRKTRQIEESGKVTVSIQVSSYMRGKENVAD